MVRRVALGFIVVLAAASMISVQMNHSNGAGVPATHCSTDGYCVKDCNPNTGFRAQYEDEPCWLIQSPYSNYQALAGEKDYRLGLLNECANIENVNAPCQYDRMIYLPGGENIDPKCCDE